MTEPIHGDLYDLACELGELLELKNQKYGDSFGKAGQILQILCPEGLRPEQYQHALTVVRILDKLSRILTDPDAFGEDPYRDIAGYGLLGANLERQRAKPEGWSVAQRIDRPAVVCGLSLIVFDPLEVELICSNMPGHPGPCSWVGVAALLDSLKAAA